MFDKAKMAAKALKLQKELKRIEATAEAGEGEVRATAGLLIAGMSMSVEIRQLELADELMGDKARAERLIMLAVNQAGKEVMSQATEKMQSIAGGLGLPGM